MNIAFMEDTMENQMALGQPRSDSRWLFWREWAILVLAGVAATLSSLPTPDGMPTSGALRTAIVAAAILFGLQHLPAASLTVAVTPLITVRAIVLNGIGGVIFGAMYWKRGLEAAMLSHFAADLVLHVILFPLSSPLLI
jgi:membrane protease YdiL (CAAX protease family)